MTSYQRQKDRISHYLAVASRRLMASAGNMSTSFLLTVGGL